jgi:LmbE family N-acetylglucosaminyl deacetylase
MNLKKVFACALLALLLGLIAACALGETAKDITKKCKISASNGGASKMTDGKVNEYWEAKKSFSTVTVKLPSGTKAGGMLIEWFVKFTSFEYTQYDQDGAVLRGENSDGYFQGTVTWLNVEPEAVKLELKVYSKGRICGLHVYSQGDIDPEIQMWENPPEKLDLMLIVAHQDDEQLWFGGLLPYYCAVRDSDVQVIYMTSCGRARIKESLNGLWTMGVKTVPEVVGFKNSYTTVKESTELWGGKENIERSMVRLIRKYRPEVIVTHDIKGEYGHPQHKLIAMRIVDAAKAAADPNQYSDSAALYGAWEVKKVYLHLGDTNTIYMDWNTPSERLGGKTPLEMATLGFKEHKSQQKRYNMDMGKKYDYTKFSLVYTTVGPDVMKNDFLENTPALEP